MSQAPPDVMKRIEKGLDELLISARARQSQVAAAAAQGTLNDPVLMDDDDSMLPDDDDDDDELEGAIVCADKRNEEARDDTRMRNEFKSQMEATGIRSAVRGVVALTATPAACGHDLSAAASKVMHHVCAMEHPGNYVGYEFTAAPYAERKIKHEPVPDRKQITAIKKGLLYPEVLKRNSWWDTAHDQPMPPFRRRADGAIVVFKRDLTDIEEGNDKSSTEIKALVDTAYRESARRGDKVLESDGVGIALMLEAMSELSANQEPERRALIVSNYTRTNDGKLKLARHILNGELTLEDGRQLPENCVSDIFVIIFDHKVLRIMCARCYFAPSLPHAVTTRS